MFIRERVGSRGVVAVIRFHFGSFRLAKRSLQSLWFAWVHSGEPKGRLFHSGSRARGFTHAHKDVVGFIPVRVASHGLT